MSGSAKKRILNVLIVFFILIAAYALFRLIGIYRTYAHNRQVQQQVQELFYEEISRPEQGNASLGEASVPEEEQMPIPGYNFEPLLECNPDVMGWLVIEAAHVDHAVVQGEDNDEYLHKNLYGEYEYAGTMFMDCRCEWPISPNTVIYGHSMADGSMLGRLRQYLKPEVGEEYPFFWYITPQQVYRCDIFSTYLTTVEEEYLRFDFADEEDFLEYVQERIECSEYSFPDVSVQAGDQILTISTCNYDRDGESGRQAVHAKLIPVDK